MPVTELATGRQRAGSGSGSGSGKGSGNGAGSGRGIGREMGGGSGMTSEASLATTMWDVVELRHQRAHGGGGIGGWKGASAAANALSDGW